MSDSPLSDPPDRDGIAIALDIEYLEFGDGGCCVGVTLNEKHLNKGGVAHGAMMTTLLDKALGGALVSLLKKEEWCATAQLSTSFIDVGRSGERLLARGKVIRKGRGVAHLTGEVRAEDGRLIATGNGTWAIFGAKPRHYPEPENS
ncbi:MAG TPA: PaaI family thioesterase [Candidatus Poseidoniales archaeon]|nr:PaaI family thioesterase [Candidatus Poseidoniales archaeon]